MSLPRPASYSSSPSKSSLRSANSHSRPTSRGHLPSPKFDDVVRFHPHPSLVTTSTVSTIQQRQNLEDKNEEAIGSSTQHAAGEGTRVEDEDQAEEEDGGSKLTPFFTLIADESSGAHYHPTVHYVFADDDAEIITRAACNQLEQDETAALQGIAGATDTQSSQGRSSNHNRKTQTEDEPGAKKREHVLIIDVAPSAAVNSTIAPPSSSSYQALGSEETATPEGVKQGREEGSRGGEGGGLPYTITTTSSLSADWQVLSSEITTAPSFDGIATPGTTTTSVPPGSEAGLMLRIEGTGVLGDGDRADGRGRRQGNAIAGANVGEGERLEELVRRFEDGLDVVRRVLDQGSRPPHGRDQQQQLDHRQLDHRGLGPGPGPDARDEKELT